MTAFVPASAPGSFTAAARTLPARGATSPVTAPRMTANWPDDTSAPYSKYLSAMPMERVNKAPLIQIASLPNPDYNSVSVQLTGVAADEAAAEALTNGIDIEDDSPPPQHLWAKYYDPATVNTAPLISLNGGDVRADLEYVSVIHTTVFKNLKAAKALLEPGEPDPAAYTAAFGDHLNQAPTIQIFEGESDDDSTVSVEQTNFGLRTRVAGELLAKLRS